MTELSPEERRRIYEEEKARIESSRSNELEKQKKKGLSTSKIIGYLLLTAVILVFLTIFIMSLPSSRTGGNKRARNTKQTPVSASARIQSVSKPIYQDREPGLIIKGVLKNIGNKSAKYVKVFVYLYDSRGNLLDSDWFAADKSPLEPNEQSPWTGTFLDDGRKMRSRLDKSRTKIEFQVLH